jgi:acetolactate synthase-1/2/3 large subunit
MMTVGEAIARSLEGYGVTCVFGMEDPVHITHGFRNNIVRSITVRDEKHGAIMAHGYAKATSRPGICLATCGPGATNLITGLLEAQKSSMAVIAFVQEIPLKNRDRHAASEIDHAACLAPYVKWVGRIELAERALEITRRAFRVATSGRPGPVVVLCPPDVMAQTINEEIVVEDDYKTFPSMRTRPERALIERAANVIADARRLVILAGGGVLISRASEEIVALAEALHAPVVTTMNGKGAIADNHPLSAGVSGSSTGGRYGRGKIANALLAEADAVLIVGSRNGQICSFNWTLPRAGTKIIHIDVDPIEIGRNFPTDVGLVGDARETLRDLAKIIAHRSNTSSDFGLRLEQLRNEWIAETREVFASGKVPIMPERLLREISCRLKKDAILVSDASYTTGWATSHIDSAGHNNGHISPRGTGGIGWSLPAAIGAKMASPERDVVCIAGDGAFGYVFNELETAARYAVPVVVVVFNNASLAFQKHHELKLFGKYRECDFSDVDFSAIARTLGCQGERVTEPDDIGAAIDRALNAHAPYVIDVVIDADAMAPIAGLERELKMEAH